VSDLSHRWIPILVFDLEMVDTACHHSIQHYVFLEHGATGHHCIARHVVKERENMAKPDDVPRVAYTVPEFCEAHRLSLSMYYKLKKARQGPCEGHAGTKVIITFESAAAWRKRIEKPCATAAE
jgi:hypothetical protein